MQIEMMAGKIHRAVVTEADLNYVGSITIDSELLRLSGMREYQKVQVLDVDNGNRLETYIIAGEPNSGVICINGAAARLVHRGDTVIIIAYAMMSPEEADAWSPKVVHVDSQIRTQ